MEIAPIAGIRSASLLDVHSADAAQLPAFEIDASARTCDETYSSSSQSTERGLEEEDSNLVEDGEPEPETLGPSSKVGARISFFA